MKTTDMKFNWSIPLETQLATKMLTAWRRRDDDDRRYVSDPAFRKLAVLTIDFICETLDRQGRLKEVFDLVEQQHPEYAKLGYMQRLKKRWIVRHQLVAR
jgi:ATP sulfurylase